MKRNGNRALRNLRRARTINQVDFARMLGIAQKTYSRYEAGLNTPTIDMQARIAAILGVSPMELWPATNKPADEPKAAQA